MKKTIASIALALLLFSCNKNDKTSDKNEDKNFDAYKEYFVSNLWKQNPDWASSQGFHKYDSILIIPTAANRKQQLDIAKVQLDSLQQYDIESLSDNNKTDYHMMKNLLESSVFSINEVKSFEWDPSGYNVCGSFAEILNGNYDSIENRLRNFNLKMNGIPAYYEAAKANIKNPTLEHTELAIAQNLGGISVFKDDLKIALDKSKLTSAEKEAITTKANTAVKAIQDYASYLQKLEKIRRRVPSV